ncbi:MAG: hypothetical protein K0Q48_908 [Bacillota bacterium]|jgi:HAD superfamily hydrolase (TIGR01509 family)|nr:hypothetical protein [Bacillota bacterium]
MIKGIVFDMDGLMFDTERLAKEAWTYAGTQLGLNITQEMVIKTLGLNIDDTNRVLMEELGEAFDLMEAREIRAGYVTDFIENNGIPMKNGLLELLNYLKGNDYKITVATSSEHEVARYNFRRAGISDFFDQIVCGDMIEQGKPAPDIYLRASEIIGIPPDECLALEDSPMGILAAHRAGLKPVMIPDLKQPDEETTKLLYARLTTLHDVIELLTRENKSI